MFHGRDVVADLDDVGGNLFRNFLHLFQEKISEIGLSAFDARALDRLPPHIRYDEQVGVRQELSETGQLAQFAVCLREESHDRGRVDIRRKSERWHEVPVIAWGFSDMAVGLRKG